MFRNLRRLLARSPSRYQHKSPPRCRTRLLVEVLEDRAVPSVSVVLHGHTLNIVDGDTTGHTINVNQTANQDQFTVQVDAGPVRTFDGVSKINADLGADNDNLNFNNDGFSTYLSGNLSVTAGDGSNTVVIDFTTIMGRVSVAEGNGSDSVHVGSPRGSFTIGGNLSITQGNGNEDQLFVDDNGTGSFIGGHLSVTQGNGDADVIQVMGVIAIDGNLSMAQGNGGGMAGSLFPYGNAAAFGLGVTVGGNFGRMVCRADR
jgi:hypothetical protein